MLTDDPQQVYGEMTTTLQEAATLLLPRTPDTLRNKVKFTQDHDITQWAINRKDVMRRLRKHPSHRTRKKLKKRYARTLT